MSTLSQTSLASLSAFFAAAGHSPSTQQMTAIRAVHETLEAMAEGKAESKYHLSAIDPGVGKTQSVAHFCRALVASEAHRHVGLIVCVGRLTEARALALDLAGVRNSLCVSTSDPEINALGAHPTAETGQLLITTQQALEKATDGKPFELAERFYYQGAPRTCRVWDEAWLPGISVVLTEPEIVQIAGAVGRKGHSDLYRSMLDFAISLSSAAHRALVSVPAWPTEPLFDLMAAGDLRDDVRASVQACITMSGTAARLMKSGREAATLTYRDTMPPDLAPMLILDASGRVRATYRNLETHRNIIKRLPEATKSYAALTVHSWTAAASKSGWKANTPKLLKAIVDTVMTKPTERWLIVHHKDDKRMSVGASIVKNLPANVRPNVSTLSWGQHMATNEYRDVTNVILAGTLFYKPAHYAALTHLSQDASVIQGLASDADITETAHGEHANLILQALCRGSVRKSVDGVCGSMTAWIIAAARSGIAELLPTVFPGCTVLDWNPEAPKPRGKVDEVEAWVKMQKAWGVKSWRYTQMQQAVGVTSKNWWREVVGLPEWQAAMDRLGLVSVGDRRTVGVRLARPN